MTGAILLPICLFPVSYTHLDVYKRQEVTMPEEYMGDVIGDINSRRGRIEGMEDIGGGKMVKAYVPLSEM